MVNVGSQSHEALNPLRPGRWHLRLAAIAVVVAFVSIAFVSVRQSGPTVHPDEWGFLTNGQILIGHTEATMPTTSFYTAGYGLITGAGALLTGSIQGAYRFSLIMNLFFALATAWVAARVGRRIFGLSPAASQLAGLLVLVLPGTLLSSVMVWPEVAARLAFLVLLMVVHRAVSRPSRTTMLQAAAYTGLLPVLHGRFTLVLGVVGLLFVWLWRKKIVSFVLMVQSGCLLVVGYAISYMLNTHIKGILYTESYDQENRLLRRLTKPRLWPALIRMTVGQSWYLIATTAGLFAVGIAFALHRVMKMRAQRDNHAGVDATSVTLGVAFFSVAVVVFTGSLQLMGFNRGDHLIYGRYAELTVPVVVLLSVVALDQMYQFARRVWMFSVLSIPVVAVVYVSVDRNDGIAEAWKVRNVVFPNIVGTDAVRYLVPVGFLWFAAAFFVIAGFLWFVARRRRELAVLLAIVLLAGGLVVSANKSISHRTRFLDAITTTPALLKRESATEVAFDSRIANDPAYYFIRYKIHPVRLRYVRSTSAGEAIPASITCIYQPVGVAPSGGAWVEIAEEPAVSRVLWRRAGADHC